MRRIVLLEAFFLLFSIKPLTAAEVSLKISAGQNWLAWGDYILGQDLKKGIENAGYSVTPAYIGDFYPQESNESYVDIYMHGFIPFNPPKDDKKVKVMYLYYPLETANTKKFKNLKDYDEPQWMSLQTELWDFDVVAVASPTYKKQINKLGLKTIFVPQFTDPNKFFYEYDEALAYDILFVGRPGYRRISAEWAIESGFNVALFGDGWQTKAPKEYFKGVYIDNTELHKYYASAKIVLNDTREDMKKAGFISNRVFDVTAAGGFLISDYMPEIEQFYGDSIPMFKTKEELKELIDYYLAHPEERAKKAKQAQKVTLENFTNDLAAKKIMQAAKEAADKKIQTKKNTDSNKLVIKSPWGKSQNGIGDYWLGLDLEDGLRKAGFETNNYYYNRHFYPDEFYNEAGNLLYLQFKYNHTQFEDEEKAKIMYLYFPTFVPEKEKFKNTKDTFLYNTDASLNNELLYFDMIATPAKKTYKELKNRGYKTAFVPQFTNPDKFKPVAVENLKSDILFVGSNWYERKSVKYALEYGYNLAVYGLNWEETVPKENLKGKYIRNNVLTYYYASAKIVLNDQAQDLSDMGLVINRLYDASAAGAFVISEYSPYIEEIFGDSIPTFKSKKEFKKLVDYYLEHPEERAKKAAKARQITLKGYTNLAAAEKLKQLFEDIRRDKK